jgi:hypothetical protein
MLPAAITPQVEPHFAVARNVYVIKCANHICRKLVALCMALFMVSTCRGTVVILVNNGDNIWVGTDSLQSNATKTAARSACKINRERTFYWAVATPIVADSATGFNFSKVVTEAHPKGTLHDKMRVFINKAQVPLSDELSAIKKTAPDFFATFLTYKALFQVLFIGIENKHPRFTWAVLNAQESKGIVEITSQGPEMIDSAAAGVFSMGEDAAARAYISAHMDELGRDPVRLIRDSITTQAHATPNSVGGAVSIAKIDSAGFSWIQKGNCQ